MLRSLGVYDAKSFFSTTTALPKKYFISKLKIDSNLQTYKLKNILSSKVTKRKNSESNFVAKSFGQSQPISTRSSSRLKRKNSTEVFENHDDNKENIENIENNENELQNGIENQGV